MEQFRNKLIELLKKETGLDDIPLEIPPDQKLGDYAFPCFMLAKQLKKSPVVIANELAGKINAPEFIKEARATGPYVNFFLDNAVFTMEVLGAIAGQKAKYGSAKPKKQKVMVEFFHANTHKGIHIGHIRNISMAEPLCRTLEYSGYEVLRVNYQGDIGPHVAKAIWGYLNLGEKPPKKHKGVWLGKIYAKAHQKAEQDEKVAEEIKDINIRIYENDKKLRKIWQETRQWCLDDFDDFYRTFKVKFDELYFESETEQEGKAIALELLKKGIAEKSDGAIIVDLKKYDMGVCIILTSQGYALYQTKELGLAKKKLEKHSIDRSIHVVGQEQELFFRQIFKVYGLMGSPLADKSFHLSYGLVMLPEGKMSSREGTMVLYSDLIGEMLSLAKEEIVKRHNDLNAKEVEKRAVQIAFGALKFSMVSRETNKNIIFDKQAALDFEGETGPYIQYAHARLCSILEKVEKMPISADFSLLKEPAELVLITLLSRFPEIAAEAAEHLKPHLVARYVLELAQSFNAFYHAHQVLKAEDRLKNARLVLIASVKQVLQNGLHLLNIDAPEKM